MSVAEAISYESPAVFTPYARTVGDYVRYELVRRNLGTAAVNERLKVLAVGGESAVDALGLALDHEITVFDSSGDHLGEARQRLGRLPLGLAERLDVRSETLPLREEEEPYDLALCHLAAMYSINPKGFIRRVARLVKPGGQLSLLERGFYGSAADLLSRNKYSDATTLETTDTTTDAWHRKIRTVRPRGLIHEAREAGVRTFEWSGVCVTRGLDNRPFMDIPRNELNRIVAREEESSHQRDVRGTALYLHLIGQVVRVPSPR